MVAMTGKAERSGDEKVQRLGEEIKGIRIAMLTTAEDDGVLRSRPMAVQEADFDGDLWFFTQEHTPKVEEVSRDRHVNVSFARESDQRWVSVSGLASVVRDDRRKMEELWKPFLKTWFPKGLDDPELALLRVQVTQAEIWDQKSGLVENLAGFVKAVTTGQPSRSGESEKITLRQGIDD